MAPMLNRLLIGIVSICIMSLVAGCQGFRAQSDSQSGPAKDSIPSARAYYYFSAAQLKLKQGDINEAIYHLKQALQYDSESAYLKLEMANLLLIKKEDAKALALIQEVLAKQPDDTQALIMSGRIYQQRNELDKALAAYEKVLQQQPADEGVYLMAGRIYWQNNRLNEVESVFRQMTVNIPSSYVAYYYYGKVLAAQGKLEMAEKALAKSLDLEPSLVEPRFELLKIYQATNNQQKITQTYQSILALDPNNHEALLGLAEHFYKLDQRSASLEILHKLGRRIDRDPTILSALFEIYLENKRFADGLWALNGMLQSAPHNSDLHYFAGVASNGLEQDNNALKHLKVVEPGSRFYANAVVLSAMIYHDQGKIDYAIDVVQKALSHDPGHTEYYLYLGSFYEELERFDEAVEVLHQGIDKDARNGKLHFRMGVIYDKMGLKDRSIAAMKNVLRLTPNDAEALNYLGYTYADMGIHLDEAETLIRSALRIKPDDGYIKDSLGWVYYKRGEYDLALEWLSKAVKLVPDDPVILEHLGDVYLKMDSKEKALQYYQRSLQKNSTARGTLKEKIRTLTHP